MGDPDSFDGLDTVDDQSDLDVDGLYDDATELVEPFSAGSFFGDRFKIEAPLGAGGMGAVYRAIDLDAHEPVALKILLKGRQDEAARERFQREYDILSSLKHPGIIGIRGFGMSETGVPWLAMELLEGETLRERVLRRGAMDPAELAPILTATCDALAAAHAAGVVHRDLKPDHIFLPKERGTVRLLDFGLSLATSSKKLTATGTIIGTPRYMAPEQIASAHGAGAPADIYALGVIFYEALTGQSPFTASDQGQLLGAILTGRTEPLEARRPDLPAELGEVLRKAMAKDPAQRFQRPHELCASFALAAGLPAPLAFSPPPPRVSQRPPAEQVRPKLWVHIALGLLGFVVAAAGAFLSYLLLR